MAATHAARHAISRDGNAIAGVAGRTWTGRNWAIEAVLLFGIGYNFVLALVNANVTPIGPSWAYAAEGLAYASCVAIAFRSLDRGKLALVLAGLALVLAIDLLRFLLTWQFDPKFLRDALIPFAFLMLGAAYSGSVPNLFMRLLLLVCLVATLEVALPGVYGDLVDPRSYFVNTRGSVEEDFWNEDSKLYVSAIRPGERNWLATADLPRASSIFVEPVTMGNFIIFFAAIALTFWRFYGPIRKIFAVAAVLFLMIASDGRLASATCLLMLLLAPILRRTEQALAAAIFVAVMLGGWLLVIVTGTTFYDDTTVGRVFVTVQAMAEMSAKAWFGLDFAAPYTYSDSGIAYFISSQSIIVVLAFLVAYSIFMRMKTSDGQLFKNLFIFAFALSLLVSNGYFSVKTAALWWFVCGWLWQRSPSAGSMAAVKAPASPAPRPAAPPEALANPS